ncbi:MAG: hypothetical protein WEF50_23405 [Myxococcota bacterium]
MQAQGLVRAFARGLLAGALTLSTLGCGELTIRTWVTVIEEESDGTVEISGIVPEPVEYPLGRIQGGFLSTVKVDTRDILGPLHGTIVIEDLRIAAIDELLILGDVCAWGDPNGASGGTVVLDLQGGPSSVDVALDLRATTWLTNLIGVPVADIDAPATIELGEGFNLETLLAAQASGSADGLFETDASFSGETAIGGLGAVFNLDLALTNLAEPPQFTDLAFCGPFFDEQGTDLFYGMNSKSAYLRVDAKDKAAAPLAISLAEIGAVPGDTLQLSAVGTYSDANELRDGTDRKLSGVFSTSDTVLAAGQRARIPGAIDAGANVGTKTYLECFLIFCTQKPSDIAQDFRIDPQVSVVIPAGAQYLFVSPLAPSQKWGDNSGFGFGVNVLVNP